ncbi:MAG: transglycosylase domain-containing protein [Gammaproteobacteria bacterium]
MNRHWIHRVLLLYCLAILVGVGVFLLQIIREELETSKYQAHYLSALSKQLSFKIESGPSASIQYPEHGPYDRRLGYTLLPDMIQRLKNNGFGIIAQASISPMMSQLNNYGLFSIYQEKNQTGLQIIDRDDQVLFNVAYPNYAYPNFESIPPLILYTLLFIENRELINEHRITRNPAIEWDRLGFAVIQLMAKKLGADINVAGGSTLATQLEKYRHSPNGMTDSVKEKIRQMVSASIRAYSMGPDTRGMRKQIALAYLNTMPLAAVPKLGEVHGLGDGLIAWFNSDFNRVNQLLSQATLSSSEGVTQEQAQAYRQVLSLLLSQRRPTYLLGAGFNTLQDLTDSYLRLLTEHGIISSSLRDAALKIQTQRNLDPAWEESFAFSYENKMQSVLRTRLANTLGLNSNYDLDRLDLTAKTTLDLNIQKTVALALQRLNTTEGAREAGAMGFRLLNPSDDLSPVIFSLMLYERGETGNLLRIQADNYDQPLDINEGIRIDLGSTAKLRTMVHYLELITEVYRQYSGRSGQDLSRIELHSRDYISAWVIEQLRINPKIDLENLLNKALDRRYSASPYENFFTGGGVHHFSNFTRDENNKIMSIRHALRDSVNLVFIRLMREIVYHHLYKPDGLARWLEIPGDPRYQIYLKRFADWEGSIYLRRFYATYQGKSIEENLDRLTRRVKAKSSRLTMLYQSIYPNRDINDLSHYLTKLLPATKLADADFDKLHSKYTTVNFDLQDQGYITKLHPLELWLVRYLAQFPDATRQEVLSASVEPRQNVYRWLFKSRRKSAQKRRILTLLEMEAFKEIHKAWERLGYPFKRLTPSYATALGASGDRPAALAELIGILQNDGERLPLVRFESLHFAKNTPYETLLDRQSRPGQHVLAPEIAKVARQALVGVVENGTAIRLRSIYADPEGNPIIAGGKTGTGDHRREIWDEKGRLIKSTFISRAATFAFFLGDRFFGVMTAYVAGPNAENYHFTSSLPVQIVKSLAPTLSPLLNRSIAPAIYMAKSSEPTNE